MKRINVNALFELIDQELIDAGVPIHHRFMDATAKLSIHFDDVAIPLSPSSSLPDNPLGNQLSAWLHDWYEKKYGTRRKINIDLGWFVILLKGDLWRYRIPNYFGTCNFFVNLDLSDKGASNETNILRMCSDMTQSYVNTLTDIDLNRIMKCFNEAREAYEIMSFWNGAKLEMWNAACVDLENAKNSMLGRNIDFGQARWSFLQFAEKIAKSWLLKAGFTGEVKKLNHSLPNILNAYNQHHANTLAIADFALMQCSADVRYSGSNVTREQAIQSHDAALHLVRQIGFYPK